jgi:hypothetical protein
MNWKVATVFVLTIAALIVLYLYSFGPLSEKRNQAKANPVSVKPTSSEQVTIPLQSTPAPSPSGSTIASAVQPTVSAMSTATAQNEIAFGVYHNKDKKENFYTIKLPSDWRVRGGGKPGSYALTFNGGSGSVELMDVPDNTTLELYVLSREEPRLKKSRAGYSRIDYRKETSRAREGYELVYESKNGEIVSRTLAVYVAGPDEAIAINFTAAPADFENLRGLFASIVNSFQWESK